MDSHHRGEAGGRLDFLGGLAAEQGALILSKGTRATTRVEISPRDGHGNARFSCQSERERAPFSLSNTALRALISLSGPEWRARWESKGAPFWMNYVWGSFGAFTRETRWWPDFGLHFRVASDLPRARGVSSSSALCLATLRALAAVAGRDVGAAQLARMARHVEREVVGASCDLGEVLACASGGRDGLLPVLCRPDRVGEAVSLPEGVIILGISPGAARGADEFAGRSARMAAHLGRAILEHKLGPRHYLSEYAPSQLGDELPLALLGSDFRARFGASSPPALDEGRVYSVRAATRFCVEENYRALLAQSLLRASDARFVAPLVGELLFQSHAGLAAMGLSSPSCDAVVEAIRARGLSRGFYGARVSGEGARQTVVVLLERSAQGELDLLRPAFDAADALIE